MLTAALVPGSQAAQQALLLMRETSGRARSGFSDGHRADPAQTSWSRVGRDDFRGQRGRDQDLDGLPREPTGREDFGSDRRGDAETRPEHLHLCPYAPGSSAFSVEGGGGQAAGRQAADGRAPRLSSEGRAAVSGPSLSEAADATSVPRMTVAHSYRCQSDLSMRYPRLRVPEDFTHLFASWVHTLIPPTAGGHTGPLLCIAPTSCFLEALRAQQRYHLTAYLYSLSIISAALAAGVPTLKDSVPAALTVVQGCLRGCRVRVALLMDCGVQGVPEASRQPTTPSPAHQVPGFQSGCAWAPVYATAQALQWGRATLTEVTLRSEDACLVRTAVRAAAGPRPGSTFLPAAGGPRYWRYIITDHLSKGRGLAR